MRNCWNIGLLLARIFDFILFSAFVTRFVLLYVKSYFQVKKKIGKNEPSKAGQPPGWRVLCMSPAPSPAFPFQ